MDNNELAETLNGCGISTTKERDNNDPVKSLGIAMIVLAVEDLNAAPPKNKLAKSYDSMYKTWRHNKAGARTFIFSDNSSLDFWCTAAQVDMGYIREKVKLMMGGAA
jgi:hypothetical protein